jgi:hypothetical protein
MRNIGRMLYTNLRSNGILKTSVDNQSIIKTIEALDELLTLFQSTGYISSYRLGEQVKPGQEQYPLFDELDDAALKSGSSVDCLVTVNQPAILRASLQIVNEQSRFLPDFVGPTMAALWEAAGLSTTWEVFFVDPDYRPNPKDYFPTEELFQFTITRR